MGDIGNGPDGDAVGDDRARPDSSAGSEAARALHQSICYR